MIKQKKLMAVLLVLLIVLLAGAGLYLKSVNSASEPATEEETVKEIVEEEAEKGPDYEALIAMWDENYAINEDYVGQLYFESGLIDLPVVQADDNDAYYRHDWETGNYDEEGSVFVDYRNTLRADQNTIIYGHNVEASYEPSLTHKFTPLHVLEKEENYADNCIINFLQKDCLVQYEIVAVYRCGIYESDGYQYVKDGEPTYYFTNFNEEEFNAFKEAIQRNSYYETGVDYENYDSFLTLQTCISGSIDKFLILAKEKSCIYLR